MNTLSAIFSSYLSRNITFTVVVLFILLGRTVLKKSPRKFSYILWGGLGLRAVFDIGLKLRIPEAVEESRPVRYVFEFSDVVMQNADNVQTVSAAGTAPVMTKTFVFAVFALIWMTGLFVFALKGITSYIRLQRKVRISYPESGRIYRCDYIDSPITFGFVSPRIYLPSSGTEKIPDFVTEHEMTHIKRGDLYFKLLAFMILGVYWMNPLAWIAFDLFNLDMELSCDEAVLDKMGISNGSSYMEWLLYFSSEKKEYGFASAAFGSTDIRKRMENIMNHKKKGLLSLIAGSVVVLGVAAVCLIKFNDIHANQPDTAGDAAGAVTVTDQDADSVVVSVTVPDEEAGEYADTTVSAYVSTDADDVVTVQTLELTWPVEGSVFISRGYSDEHKGMDVAAAGGTNVFAMCDGVVAETGFDDKQGNYMLVNVTDDLQYRYCHLESVLVDEGDSVKSGDIVATVGNTGMSTGPHLHFEMLSGGESVELYYEKFFSSEDSEVTEE
jgi:beta-lactamase regulating signal transducer with metallopeptidase domain